MRDDLVGAIAHVLDGQLEIPPASGSFTVCIRSQSALGHHGRQRCDPMSASVPPEATTYVGLQSGKAGTAGGLCTLSPPVANLQQQTAATTQQHGGSRYAY